MDERNKPCYFCGSKETVRFHEHYTFCTNCSAIYTFLMVRESNCNHMKDGVPLVEHGSWYSFDPRTKPYIYAKYEREEYGDGDGVFHHCSICHESCVADGW
jgi:hypothetical protein